MKRAVLLLICLPLMAFVFTCSGGGKSTQNLSEADNILNYYQGSIGGQIRAVASTLVSIPDSEPIPLILWGLGSSIQYASGGVTLGPLILKNQGVVTDMASFGTGADPKIFYGSERGAGVVILADDGTFAEKSFLPVTEGAVAVAIPKTGDKKNFYFITGDGSVMTTTESGIAGKDAPSKIVSPAEFKDGETAYLPVRLAVTESKMFVLAQKTVQDGLTPTFAQVFDPILQNIMTGQPETIVRMVDIGSKAVTNVSFTAEAGKFAGFDTFIPTDVATDGVNFYVTGLAYENAAAQNFLITKCDKPTDAEKLSCMREKAKSGDLTETNTSGGLDAFTAGFFIYRDLTKVAEKAAYFARAAFAYRINENAPPLIFHMAAGNDVVTLRAPNFLAVMTRYTDPVTGEELWNTTYSFDGRDGLPGGVPANLGVTNISGSNYSAATFVAAKREDGSGASSLEVVDPSGALLFVDTGAIKTRMEDANGSYIVAIDLESETGGTLYLENDKERKNIAILTPAAGSYVARAAYKGENLAFAWSAPGDAWRIEWQKGEDTTTRGQLTFPRTGDSKHFKDFPSVSASDEDALEQGRGIADLALHGGKLFALLYGYTGGKHYYQGTVYGGGFADGKFNPKLQGTTSTVSYKGDERDRRARIQKISKSDAGVYTVTLSCAAGLLSFDINPSSGAAPSEMMSLTTPLKNVMDLDFDETGETFAFIQGKTIRIRSTADPATDISATSLPSSETASERLSNSSIIATSKKLYVATPEGASKPFWVIDISDAKVPKVDSSCDTCRFNGLAMFDEFENRLLASSDTCGIEIYNLETASSP